MSALFLGFLPLLNFVLSDETLNKSQLYSVDLLEGKLNWFVFSKYHISMRESQVVIGKNKFMFLGNKYDQVIDKSIGKFQYDQVEIVEWVQKLKKLQQWYESQNIKFVLIIAPNKHSVYDEFLPISREKNAHIITDDISKLAYKNNIHMLDLRKKFHNNPNYLYHFTDTHWNPLGASIGFTETISYLNKSYNLQLQIPKFEYQQTYRGGGDLANFLKIEKILPKDYDNDYSIKIYNDNNICVGNIRLDTAKLEKCAYSKNTDISILEQPKYIYNPQGLNKDKILLLCDSFSVANSTLYNKAFITIYKIHYNHLYGKKLKKFVLENKPKIVIYQIVERALYNQLIVL